LLSNVQVEAVYYGQPWSTDSTLQQQIQYVDGFLQYFVTSPYIDVLKQYNVGDGSYLNDVVLPQNPPSGQTIDDGQIQQILNSGISGQQLAKPTANTLYVFFAAPGVVVTANGQNSANDFAGYHSTFTSSAGAPIYYAVIPYPTGTVSSLQLTTVQQDTLILSHEVSEGMTDPDTRTGWFDPQQGEIGDIAEGTSGTLNGYVIQGVWSQAAGRVVIPSDSTGTTLKVTGETVQGTAGQSLTTIVATLTGTAANATAASFTASITWGDGNSSSGTLTADPNGGFDITGTNTYAQAGAFPITVNVKDQTGNLVGTALGQANIAAATSSITATGTQVNATTGQQFSGVVATFTDSNAKAMVGSFTVTIAWGDGSTSPGTVTADPNGGFDVNGSHTYTIDTQHEPGFPFGGWGPFDSGQGWFDNQFFVITVTIQDNLNKASAAVESLAKVSPAPPAINVTGKNVQATSGVSFNGVVATFTSTDTKATASTFTATIDWGDGSQSSGVVTADPNGGFDVTGAHTYTSSDGSNSWWGWGNPFDFGGQYFVIKVGITDNQTQDQGQSRSLAIVAPVAPNLVVTAQSIQATAGQQFSGVVATFTDVNSSATAGSFTATIDWGDGSISDGTITADPKGGFDVSGSHTYAGVDSSSPEWGGPGPSFDDGGYSFGLGSNHYFVKITVSSTTNSDSGSGRSVATVLPPPANLQTSGTLITAVSGTAFSGTVASFTSLDTNPAASNFTASIDWGDGSTSTGTVTANPKGGFTVTGTHTYADSNDVGSDWQPGREHSRHHGRHSGFGDELYVVTVTITDQTNNNTAQAVSLVSLAPAGSGTVATNSGGNSIDPNASQNNGGQTSTAIPSPVLSGQGFTVVASQSFAGAVATFSDFDGSGANSFSATISWGDGQTSTGKISANGDDTYSITGSHVYILAGTYAVAIQLGDADGTSASAMSKATVTAVQGSSWLPAQLGQVADALTSSAEYYSNRITTAYQTYLGRGPDVDGLAYWVNRMQQGLTDEQLEAGFIGSTEYIQNHGGTGSAWVVGMYHDLLGRSPDAAGLAYWLDQLKQGAAPSSIAYGFAASAEREGQRVTVDYQQYLGRTPAPSEVNYWVNQFLSGKTNEQVISGFVASQEDFQQHYNDVRDWIFGAYESTLGRLPDAAGLDHWMSVLGSPNSAA
jgi:hypothetical protein